LLLYNTTKGALTDLNLSSNNLGQMTSVEGWWIDEAGDYISPKGVDHGKRKPAGIEFKPSGVMAIADAIPTMGALMNLDISHNRIGGFCPDGYDSSGAANSTKITATPGGPIAIAEALRRRSNMVLTSLRATGNHIPSEQLRDAMRGGALL